jgi:hypothetical protein
MKAMIADGVRVQTVVTSPPYWNLRDYGVAVWVTHSAWCLWALLLLPSWSTCDCKKEEED